MKENESTNKFSIVKFLLTTLCTIILTTFIAFTILFINVIPNWVYSDIMQAIDTTDEGIKAAKYWEELFEKQTSNTQEEYNNTDSNLYSVKGSILINLIYGRPSYLIVETFTISFLVGIVLGIGVYIIVVQKAKGRKRTDTQPDRQDDAGICCL